MSASHDDINGDGFADVATNGARTGELAGQGWSAWFSGEPGGPQPQVEFDGGPLREAGVRG